MRKINQKVLAGRQRAIDLSEWKKRALGDAWTAFRSEAIPATASNAQIADMQKAFFAGTRAVLSRMLANTTKEDINAAVREMLMDVAAVAAP